LASGGLDCIRTCQAGFNIMMIKDIKNDNYIGKSAK
jgi:hypothetical protein